MVETLLMKKIKRHPVVFERSRMAPNLEQLGPCSSNEDQNCNDVLDKPPSFLYDPIRCCRYSIVSYLGKGGFAKCYAAMELTSPMADIALKVISKVRLTKMSHLEKMRREISIHETLDHPNIVRLINYFEDVSNVYMVLELCEKKTLLHEIQCSEGGRLEEGIARVYLGQLINAVTYLHDVVGVLHRDIKPGNILLNSNNDVKLADFGLAVRIADLALMSLSVCGTPNYISPQVLNREGHSKESEAWSVGCTLYCMLVGKPPFESESLEKTYERIAAYDFSFPDNIPISRHAENIISRLFSHSVKDRIGISDILNHPFYCGEIKKSSMRASADLQCDQCFSFSGVCDCDKNVSYARASPFFHQTGAHSGDSGIGSEACLITRLPVCFQSDPQALYRQVMAGCYVVSDMPPVLVDSECPVVMVSKWVDYTNKYGFGCALSDATQCVLFSDDTSLSRRRCANGMFCYSFLLDVRRNSLTSMEWFENNPPCDPHLQRKIRTAELFGDYMDKELQTAATSDLRGYELESLVLHKRRDSILLMILAHGTAQINFLDTHYKLVLNRDKYGQVSVTVFHPDCIALTYRMVAQGKVPQQSESRAIQSLLDRARSYLEGEQLRSYCATEL